MVKLFFYEPGKMLKFILRPGRWYSFFNSELVELANLKFLFLREAKLFFNKPAYTSKFIKLSVAGSYINFIKFFGIQKEEKIEFYSPPAGELR
jgi:hypothetical protein